MKNEEIQVYRGIQRNAEMGIKAIETISDKIHDEELAIQVARESIKYSDIRNRAIDKLLQEKAEPYRSSSLKDMMLSTGIHCNTLLNTSTGHIAELMIQGSNRGIVDMYKVLNKCEARNGQAYEMAKELMDFEEKNIERLKKYL